MEAILVTNLGKVRRETLHGRSYLVAPMTMVVPGVLPGSEGPLYYPEAELGADPSIWNGMPLVVGHPMDDAGNYVSARSPDILNKYGIGYVFNSTFTDTLAGEAWFDEELTDAYDSKNLPDGEKILPRLLAGKPVELSTGLFTLNEDKPGTDPKTGRTYDAVARSYKADHLAILPNDIGACSIRDGCGILVNSLDPITLKDGEHWLLSMGEDGKPGWKLIDTGVIEPLMNPDPPLTENTMKAQLIAWLVKNCSCWKGKEKVLNEMTEDEIKLLKNQNVALRVVNAAKKGTLGKTVRNADATQEEVAPGVDIAALAEFLGVTTDAASDPVGFIKELQAAVAEIQKKLSAGPAEDAVDKGADDATEVAADPNAMTPNVEDDDPAKKKTPAGNRKKPTAQQYLDDMPPELRPIWNTAIKSYKQQKIQLIQKLTAHIKNPQQKAATVNKIKVKTVEQLEELLELMPRQPAANGKKNPAVEDFTELNLPNWNGQQGDADAPSYDGIGGGGDPTTNAGGNGDLDEPLQIPTMDYSSKTGYSEE